MLGADDEVRIQRASGSGIRRGIVELLEERSRIARELHDTLLQSFQGAILRFRAVTYMLPDRPVDARASLENAIDQARQAIAEGRDAVQGLRSPAAATHDLAAAQADEGDEGIEIWGPDA